MKKNLFNLTLAVLFAATVSHSATANTSNSPAEEFTKIPGISRIGMIEARGNVDLYVMSGDSDLVEVTHNYYQDNALIQVEHGVLRITNYRQEKLKVWVTVADLRNLSAYDQVSVQSLGKFSSIDLTLDLHGESYAKLDLDCFNADLRLNEKSKADLRGYAQQGSLLVNYAATANTTDLLAESFDRKRISPLQKASFRISVLAMVANKPARQ